ncbi:hypothetical protein QRD89_06680 [Halobacillus sp. ACCC02827]|uniref:hypothetical protein n=1 Tax=Bacillaceae TaxID=186817 RepID=UPI00030B946A|nr:MULTISPECIES: hypothetical protein [Bacillaceae]QHT46211.1 hypothetical protein M662_06795 [Bacillus sp. SB49]WJE17028.1 hypothetical protein QRD89_06680 [Halobacillus sp. ACCC02827]
MNRKSKWKRKKARKSDSGDWLDILLFIPELLLLPFRLLLWMLRMAGKALHSLFDW